MRNFGSTNGKDMGQYSTVFLWRLRNYTEGIFLPSKRDRVIGHVLKGIGRLASSLLYPVSRYQLRIQRSCRLPIQLQKNVDSRILRHIMKETIHLWPWLPCNEPNVWWKNCTIRKLMCILLWSFKLEEDPVDSHIRQWCHSAQQGGPTDVGASWVWQLLRTLPILGWRHDPAPWSLQPLTGLRLVRFRGSSVYQSNSLMNPIKAPLSSTTGPPGKEDVVSAMVIAKPFCLRWKRKSCW